VLSDESSEIMISEIKKLSDVSASKDRRNESIFCSSLNVGIPMVTLSKCCNIVKFIDFIYTMFNSSYHLTLNLVCELV
jgi:hypothetical protein